ncbi:hypothetical protein ACFSBZ_05835 [Amnibacterium flavum]|uniref:hypothetical protein n=1 Tax=Amnibacterium flavum TaxID=2173173 RepID=UPI00196A57E4|nr:hypothetical protein [Amnibacterium flavum]
MQASQAWAQRRQVSLIEAWLMHSSMQARHMAMHASSMAVMLIASIPMGRIIMRIMVMVTSAQFEHMLEQRPAPSMSDPAIASAEMVHACEQAEQASMHSCIAIMSISLMVLPLIGIAIIMSIVRVMVSSIPRQRGPDAASVTATLLPEGYVRRPRTRQNGADEFAERVSGPLR